jgi:hypothetical protein
VIADPVSPPALDQVWNLVAATSRSTIVYTASDYSKNQALFAKNLRIIAVAKSSTQPDDLFKIYDTGSRALLCLTEQRGRRLVAFVGVGKTEEEDEATILRRVYEMNDPDQAGWLMWRFHPEAWGPEDGLYTISQPSATYLTAPKAAVTNPVELPLLPANKSNPETQWWHILSGVTKKGIIYQRIRNYRSSHFVNATTAPISAAEGKVAGQRLGMVTEGEWVFSRGSPSTEGYTIHELVSTAAKKHVLWGAEFAALTPIASGTSPLPGEAFKWTLNKVDTGISTGKWYHIINLATNLLLCPNGTSSLNKPLMVLPEAGEGQQWQAQRFNSSTSFILYSQNQRVLESGAVQRCFAAAPPNPSDWIPENGLGMEFPIEARQDESMESITMWRPVKDEDYDGYALVNTDGKAMGVMKVGDREWAVVLGAVDDAVVDPQMLFRWRFVEIGGWKTPAPVTVPPAKVKSQYLPDGM